PDARGSVGERRAVPGGERSRASAPVERRLERRELLDGRVAARKGVAGDSFERHDEIVEEPGVLRGDRPLMAAERPGVLLLPADVPFAGHLFTVLAHALARDAVLDLGHVQPDIPRSEAASDLDLPPEAASLPETAQPDGKVRIQSELYAAHALDA